MKYDITRIAVCGRCINALNDYKEFAQASYEAAGQMLRRGMIRRFEDNLLPHQPEWKRKNAEASLESFDDEYHAALNGWLNRLTANSNNQSKMYKLMRAERRGLIHNDRPIGWGYPNNWVDVARKIRVLDNYSCVLCTAQNVELHVHHLVYVSNFGTHRKQNLVTLCKKCHEKEHKREFDFGESIDGLEEALDVTHIDTAVPVSGPIAEIPQKPVKPTLTEAPQKPVSLPITRVSPEYGSEVIKLNKLIVEGESFEVIQCQIKKVKRLYGLTDEQIIGHIAGFSNSSVVNILRENLRVMESCSRIEKKIDDVNANQGLGAHDKRNPEEYTSTDFISEGVSDQVGAFTSKPIAENPKTSSEAAPSHKSELASSARKPALFLMILKDYWLLLVLIVFVALTFI